ncbi:unannotated protein [freshwater metagenome]|uniref:histidine kinase n=1 Tax=freshwater metagenome TaxID=449393 RepID=A0A6J7B8U6_9ZZZZ|nr:histidine kinase [Actinomycetota bacterium]MSY51936.1 histidine kinase [Actinomycetota bacterium]MSY87134.1 histidine kinase [Actinomycetota bacterium]MTA50268.1 histidine kinase [Actinomycetota bacterium]
MARWFGKSIAETPVDPDLRLSSMVSRILGLVSESAIVVAPGERVLLASNSARDLGVVRDERLAGEELIALVRHARKGYELVESRVEFKRGRLSSGTFELLVRAVSVPELGNGTVLVLIADESESRLVDEVRRDFVANISHELKTPIGALSILAEAVVEASDDPEAVKRFAERMGTEAVRLGDLVQEIIDLSRLQSQDPLAKADYVLLEKVVSEALDRTKLSAQKRDISLVPSDAGDLAVMGNGEQLTTALTNLINNAIAYSPDHTSVGIGIEAQDDIVEIAVSDQGIGISESDIERIFERFYRVDPARSRATGGTGLGLAIVKHIVTNHGGDIRVWSLEGSGSTFTLRLPLANNSQESE